MPLESVDDFVGGDETTALAPDVVAAGGGHLVGRYAELQELVVLVECGDVELHTSRYDLPEANTVAERLEHRGIDGRAVITPG